MPPASRMPSRTRLASSMWWRLQGREVGAGLGDADDRLAGHQLFAAEAEIEVALEVKRCHVDVIGIVEPGARAQFFWWPKLTGRMLDETLGKIHFWMLFIGFHLTFLVQHLLGMQGMPRRYADYLPEDGFTLGNQISTSGAFLLGLSTLPFLYNVWKTWRTAPLVEVDDPWGYGGSLEWARPPARPRGTTSTRSRGSAPSAPRSTSSTPRPLPADGTTRPRRRRAPSSPALGPADLGNNSFVDADDQSETKEH